MLEPKANQDELQRAMSQLSEMMQDLLQRMSLHGQARRKALELVSEVDSKVVVSPGEGGGDGDTHQGAVPPVPSAPGG